MAGWTAFDDIVAAVRRTLTFGDGFSRTNGTESDTIDLATPVPAGTVEGQLARWDNTGGAWVGSTNITIGSGFLSTYIVKLNNFAGTAAAGVNLGSGAVIQGNDLGGATIRHMASLDGSGNLLLGTTAGGLALDAQGNALQNFRSARGNATSLPGSGSGDVALKLSGATASLTMSDVVDDDEANTIGFRVRVEDSDGSDAYTDDFVFHLRRASGDIRVTDGAGTSDSGATAQLTPLGVDSGYSYTLDLSDTGDTIVLSLADDGAQARVARVTSWWDTAEDVS